MSNRFKILIAGVLGLAALALTDGGVKYITRIIGVYNQQNFIVNGDFEKNTFGFSIVSPGATSADIQTGGMYGNTLRISTPSNTAELTFDIDSGISELAGLNCEGRTNIRLVDAVTTPIEIDTYVKTTSGIISNVQRTVLRTQDVWIPVSVNFPCASATGSPKLVSKIIVGGTQRFWIDSLYVGEATNITNQVVVTDWQDFPSVAAGTLITGTTTNPTYGTIVTNKAQYRYVGSDIEIKWDYRPSSAGTAGSGYYLLNIPSSMCVIDLTKVKANSTIGGTFLTEYGDGAVGTFSVHDASGTGIGIASVFSASQLRFNYQYAAGSSTSAGGWSSSFGGLNQVQAASVNAKVPCVGRSATQSAITQQCIQDGSCENTFSANIDASGVVSKENLDWISGNCTYSSGNAVCTLRSNLFGAAPTCVASTTSSAHRTWVISETTTTVSLSMRNLSQAGANEAFNLVCTRATGDYKPRFSAPALVGSVMSNSQSTLRIESALIAGASDTTVCSTSNCTVYRPTSNWIASVVRTALGLYTITYVSGTWSQTPQCYFGNYIRLAGYNAAALPATASTINIATSDFFPSAGNYDGAFNITCIGPR